MAREPGRDWAGRELAGRLGVPPRTMLAQLAEWARLGFLAKTGPGRYALPAHPGRPPPQPPGSTIPRRRTTSPGQAGDCCRTPPDSGSARPRPAPRRPHRGGAIIITSSTAGLRGIANLAHYSASKTGLVGLMRTMAGELAPHNIRVNTVHPTAVDTEMVHNKATYDLFIPEPADRNRDGVAGPMQALNMLPIPWVDPRDISNAVLFLASDEGRYITGARLPVDAGSSERLL